jgi:hypothetical protein
LVMVTAVDRRRLPRKSTHSAPSKGLSGSLENDHPPSPPATWSTPFGDREDERKSMLEHSLSMEEGSNNGGRPCHHHHHYHHNNTTRCHRQQRCKYGIPTATWSCCGRWPYSRGRRAARLDTTAQRGYCERTWMRRLARRDGVLLPDQAGQRIRHREQRRR